MWRCQKCSEEIEETFDACWNCGTSVDGVEDPGFHVETVEAVDARVGWNSFFAGAVVTAFLGYIDFVVPYLVNSANTSLTRRQLNMALVAGVAWAVVLSVGGGVAGWAGGRSERLIVAAGKGAAVFFGLLCLCLVMGPPLTRTSAWTIIALEVNFLVLGAIAATVGSIVGRRRRTKSLGAPFQYSISDLLFLSVLLSFLFASLAVLAG